MCVRVNVYVSVSGIGSNAKRERRRRAGVASGNGGATMGKHLATERVMPLDVILIKIRVP